MEIFWKTIGLYNAATWEWQLGIILIGIILTVLLTRNPQPWVKNGMKIYLIAVYLWISVIYYYIYCAERSYNEVMALFWAIMAILWGWDALSGYTTFERTRKYDWLAYFLFAMPFIYPLISMARGLTFPEMTSPVMPCSVVDRLVENILLQYPGRFPAGQCFRPGVISFLQRIFRQQPAHRLEAECEICKLITNPGLRCHWDITDDNHVY